MRHSQLGTSPPRVTKSEHKVSPMILIIETYRSSASIEQPVREFADWRARIQVEHTRISPSQQRMRMRILSIEGDGLLQQLLRRALLLRAHAPHVR